MKTNKRTLKFLSLALAASLVTPTIAKSDPTNSQAEAKVTKEETVYVNLKEDGQVEDKLSSLWIHSDSDSGLDVVVDQSNLKDIVNVKNDLEARRENDELIWDMKEGDIYYQGHPEEDLPIEITIKYFLDGKEESPQTILGKAGLLEIKIEIRNKDLVTVKTKNDKPQKLYKPYWVATVVNLPTEKFSNININKGKLVSDGSKQIVSDVSLPGLKESLGIEKELDYLEEDLVIAADVVDFDMESIMFLATSEFPEIEELESSNDLNELIDGLESLEKHSDALVEATEKVYDGQKELATGVSKLVDGTGELVEGSDKLLKGSKKLNNGVNSAHEGSKQINEGANKLAKSAGQLGQGFSELGDGTVEFSEKASQFSKATTEISAGLSNIPKATKHLKVGMNEVVTATESVQKGQEELTKGLDKSVSALKEIKAGKQKEAKVIGMLLKATDGLDMIANQVDELPGLEGLAGKMKEVLGQQRQALVGITDSSNQIIAGLDQVEQGLIEAQAASNKLSQGTKGINAGQKEINGGLGELANGTTALSDASDQLAQGSKGLKNGANRINENAKLAKKGAGQFSAGAKDLSAATKDLSDGLGDLNNGTKELSQGIAELNQGSTKLSNGGKELKDGSSKLLEGSKELKKGMNQFNEEGIKGITRKLNESDINIKDVLERKDELVKLSKGNYNFSGISEEMEGSLKFIMKTDSIKKAEATENSLIDQQGDEIKVKNKKGFINWFKGLFKRDN